MTRLIVTTDSSAAGAIQSAGLADLVFAIGRRLVWGPLPSEAEREALFAPRTTQPYGLHWLDYTPRRHLEKWGVKDCGFTELVAECESIELWIEPAPNAQLLSLWLLDHCRSKGVAASEFVMRHLDNIGDIDPQQLAKLDPPSARLTRDHLELASCAWHAYRAPTPQSWFELLKVDLGLMPQLGRVVMDLLKELPSIATGLGATETQLLERVASGNVRPFDIFPRSRKPIERRVFDYWEIGSLLNELAWGPSPAISGLPEGPFSLEMHMAPDWHKRYKGSRPSLTDFGKAVLAGEDDFRRHNPIHRWWGGTELINKRLWRWDPRSRSLVAP